MMKRRKDKLGMNLKIDFRQRLTTGWVLNHKVSFKMFLSI